MTVLKDFTFRQGATFRKKFTWRVNIWTITFAGVTGGSFKILVDNQPTAALAYNATAADVQNALNSMAGIVAQGGFVAGGVGGAWTVEPQGDLAKKKSLLITVQTVDLSGPAGWLPTVERQLKDLTGWTGRSEIRLEKTIVGAPLTRITNVASADGQLIINNPPGCVIMFIKDTVTSGLDFGDKGVAYYDVELVDPASGNDVVRFAEGILTMSKQVTA